jgi:gluconate 2-dehydrogenase gamma chain
MLDQQQIALLNAVVERLIPSDELGPGAREAQAARYILGALATDYQRHLPEYVAGLAEIDARAQTVFGAPFVALRPERQDAILEQIEERVGASDGPTPLSFFDLVLRHTREGVFGDPRWGGNADRVGWDLIGYAGPKYNWTGADQQIEFF